MTKEQIKQNAEKHADAYATPDLDDSFRVYIYEANKDGYILGATEATEELEAQIEKMRNCANCKNYNGNEGFCVLGSGYGYNCNLEKWEIKEK